MICIDFTSLDWGAICTILGAIITVIGAIWISNQWTKQKSIEVKAIEARNLLEYLFDLDALFYKRYNIYQDKNNIAIETDDKSKYEIKLLIHKVTRLLDFLDLKDDSDKFVNNIKSIEKELDIEDLARRTLAITISYQTTDKYENVKEEIKKLINVSKKIAQYKK